MVTSNKEIPPRIERGDNSTKKQMMPVLDEHSH